MSHKVYISVPIDCEVSYTLFAQGLPIDIPHDSDDGKKVIFTFKGGTVFSLFYTFANFRRAYLATEWQNDQYGEPTYLPGIDVPLYVILKAKGRKVDELKHALHILTKEEHFAPYKLPIEFWQKLSNLIEYKGSYKEEVFYLYNKYTKKGKEIK